MNRLAMDFTGYSQPQVTGCGDDERAERIRRNAERFYKFVATFRVAMRQCREDDELSTDAMLDRVAEFEDIADELIKGVEGV